MIRVQCDVDSRVSVDPTGVTTDLSDIRAAIKQALKTVRESQRRRAAARLASPVHAEAGVETDGRCDGRRPRTPVFCSDLGDLGSVVNPLDGTDAEYATVRIYHDLIE